jgi:cell division protein FtsW (lipid II flippase)
MVIFFIIIIIIIIIIIFSVNTIAIFDNAEDRLFEFLDVWETHRTFCHPLHNLISV